MEIVKTTEEEMVLHCLEQMLNRAQHQMDSGKRLPQQEAWEEHVKVIGRAIQSTKSDMMGTNIF